MNWTNKDLERVITNTELWLVKEKDPYKRLQYKTVQNFCKYMIGPPNGNMIWPDFQSSTPIVNKEEN